MTEFPEFSINHEVDENMCYRDSAKRLQFKKQKTGEESRWQRTNRLR